jgi:hypothetical protein
LIVDNKLLNNSVLSFLTIGRLFPGVLKHHETNFFPRLSPEAVNFVTLTMRANTKRQACETALYKPDPADQTTWITDARSLFVCPMAGWSILLQLFSLTVLAALVCKYRDPAKPGSGYVQLDLGAICRVDAFRVARTKGSALGATAQAQHVKLPWAHVPTALDDVRNVAGDLELPFDSSGRFSEIQGCKGALLAY